MSQFPNILVQLGELPGPGGSIVVLLLLCAGAVWVVMTIRRNQDDHARVEAMIETLRMETREESKETRAQIQALRMETREESKESRAEMQTWRQESREEIQALRNEVREESKETRAQIRSINSRLDQLIGGKPPNQPG